MLDCYHVKAVYGRDTCFATALSARVVATGAMRPVTPVGAPWPGPYRPGRRRRPRTTRPPVIGQLRRGELCQGIPPPPWVHGFTAHANTSSGRDANACADSAGRDQLSKCVRSSPVNANSAFRCAVLATHQFYEFNRELVDARH